MCKKIYSLHIKIKLKTTKIMLIIVGIPTNKIYFCDY
nr:MAG TPA: hypothetical protein [Caudoviricetes sp.]